MKRLFFSLLTLLASVSAIAQDYAYPYLVFTDADGVQTTVSVASLEITFVDGQLVATNGDGTTTLTLASLSSMIFSDAEPDAVRSLSADEPVRVYTIAGIYVGTFSTPAEAQARLRKGLYVVRQKEDSSVKLTVK